MHHTRIALCRRCLSRNAHLARHWAATHRAQYVAAYKKKVRVCTRCFEEVASLRKRNRIKAASTARTRLSTVHPQQRLTALAHLRSNLHR